jgi:phosphatidylserine/phosphatidylglycerophosphate/cardiolipin synthase-like enzyme
MPLLATWVKIIKLAKEGRVRVILDNYPNHVKPTAWETKFEALFQSEAKSRADLFRGRYQSQAHSKIFIVRRNNAGGEALKVLTGSTNFTTTGLYINANHSIVIEDREVAQLYADVFDGSFSDELMENFKNSDFALQDYAYESDTVPKMTIRFSPHGKDFTTAFFKTISDRISNAESDVLFAIMIDNSKSGILDAVRAQINNENIFTYGITDERDGIQVYKPNSKRGVKISALDIETNLPPPFNKIVKIGLGHVIHHKFVVVDFKGKNPVVYCGSSNLAFGPEQKNGDNLIEIHDRDVVTAFAIEAIRLIDHFHWLNRKITDQEKTAGYSLRDGREAKNWYAPYYKDSDLRFVERNLLIKKT